MYDEDQNIGIAQASIIVVSGTRCIDIQTTIRFCQRLVGIVIAHFFAFSPIWTSRVDFTRFDRIPSFVMRC